MGISRDTLHKHRNTGAKRKVPRSKRKFELGRQAAMTKLAPRKVTTVRGRGGALKYRALRLDHGNFAWASEHCTRKSRLLVVSYNAVSNELLRTNTLVKGAIIQVDATPFKQFYEKHYGVALGKVKEGEAEAEQKLSHAVLVRQKTRKLEPALEAAFKTGRLLARISSRPGQVGRADGYILEGEELAFYSRKLAEKKKKGTVAK